MTNKNNAEIMFKICFLLLSVLTFFGGWGDFDQQKQCGNHVQSMFFFTFGAQFLVLFWVFDQYLLKRHTRELFGPPRAQAGRALRPSPHPGCTRESACPVRRLKVVTEEYGLELSLTFGAHFFWWVDGF